nr:exodeoxyribonuclease I [Vibrio splendidus]MCC4883227.1 exodeoxyribonuclease I [Vibrio splendidus]
MPTKNAYQGLPIKLDPINYEKYFVYDYETSSIDKHHGQPVQGAWILTDKDLTVIPNTEGNVFCKLRPDVVPTIDAFLITKIDPATLKEKGVSENEFSKTIQIAMQQHPKTCISGYNTMKFDDEVTRNLMFRNNRRMYDHEWKNSNGRVDFYNLVKMAYAYYPDVITFPRKEDGKVSLKLEDLCIANNILHEQAHDALSDVVGTIQLARLIKERQPRMFDYFVNLSNQNNVRKLLTCGDPLFYTERVIDEERCFTTMLYPVVKDSKNDKAFLCVDLTQDPSALLNSTPEEIRKLMFTKRAELPEDAPRLGVHSIKTNKQPILRQAVGKTIPHLCGRFGIDMNKCLENLAKIQADPKIKERLQQAFINEQEPASDVYGSIYSGGFLSNNDMSIRDSMQHIVNFETNETGLSKADVYGTALRANEPKRVSELLLRSKWNTYLDNLLASGEYSPVEFRHYLQYVSKVISFPIPNADNHTISQFKERLKELEYETTLTEQDQHIVNGLRDHVEDMERNMSMLREIDTANNAAYKNDIAGDSNYKKLYIKMKAMEESSPQP